MSQSAEEQVLGPTDAARLIFNTAEPTAEQIVKVRGEIKRGTLARSRQGGYTTTADAVATYFASRAADDLLRHVGAAPANEPPASATADLSAGHPELGAHYQVMLKDYFLGIFLQRQSRQYPDVFQRAVLAGQVLLVLGIAAILLWVACDATGMLALGKSPERVAVERWIEEKHGPFEIVSVTPGSEETDLRVRYIYRAPSGKQIQSDRLFRVVEGNVSLVVSD